LEQWKLTRWKSGRPAKTAWLKLEIPESADAPGDAEKRGLAAGRSERILKREKTQPRKAGKRIDTNT
jgi:hypothetical protein